MIVIVMILEQRALWKESNNIDYNSCQHRVLLTQRGKKLPQLQGIIFT